MPRSASPTPRKKKTSRAASPAKRRPASAKPSRKRTSRSKAGGGMVDSVLADAAKLAVPLSLIAAKEGMQYLQARRASGKAKSQRGGNDPVGMGGDLTLSELSPPSNAAAASPGMAGGNNAAVMDDFKRLADQIGGFFSNATSTGISSSAGQPHLEGGAKRRKAPSSSKRRSASPSKKRPSSSTAAKKKKKPTSRKTST